MRKISIKLFDQLELFFGPLKREIEMKLRNDEMLPSESKKIKVESLKEKLTGIYVSCKHPPTRGGGHSEPDIHPGWVGRCSGV
jgi:hypothetical protein